MHPTRPPNTSTPTSEALEKTFARAITWLGGLAVFFLCVIVAILGSGIAIVLLLGIIQYISSPDQPGAFGRLVKNVIENSPGILGYVTVGLMIVLALGVVGALAILAWRRVTQAGSNQPDEQSNYRISQSRTKGITSGDNDVPAISPPAIDAEFKEEGDQ